MNQSRQGNKKFFLAAFLLSILSLWCPIAGAVTNPVAFITSISPVSAPPGGADFTLTVNGANFVPASTINWDSTALMTTYVSAKQLTATVTAALIAIGGTGWITVSNPGAPQSNVFLLARGKFNIHNQRGHLERDCRLQPLPLS